MKVTKAVLKGIISKIVLSVNNVHKSKLKLCKDLAWARNVVNWYYTDYKSFGKFCKAHISLASGTIYGYIRIAELVSTYGYTDAQCDKMIEALGWTRFKLGLIDMNHKLSVKGFIEKYKNFVTTAGDSVPKDGTCHYAFHLPKHQARKLDTVLKAYGMTIGESGRKGLSKAMIKLVNRKLK